MTASAGADPRRPRAAAVVRLAVSGRTALDCEIGSADADRLRAALPGTTVSAERAAAALTALREVTTAHDADALQEAARIAERALRRRRRPPSNTRIEHE
jgi:Xaa-Pro aminopeptidase